MRLTLWPLLLVMLSFPAWGWDSNITLPEPAPVVDQMGLLQPGDIDELGGILRSIKQASGVEITVYITPSLQGRAIEDFSIAVAEKWKLGRKKEDKGLLFLVAPKERKMRFEVGYGLEGALTDAFTGQVLDNTVRPLFREGKYYQGIVAGIVRLQEKVPLGLDEKSASLYPPPESLHISVPLMVALAFFLIVFFFPLLGLIFGLSRRGYIGRSHTYWGGGGWGGGGGSGGWGGGSGGGSWGGGGGGFGGGGSSSSW